MSLPAILPELAAHQAAQLNWMAKHKPHLMTYPPPPPPPVCTCYYQVGPCAVHGTNHINAQQTQPPDNAPLPPPAMPAPVVREPVAIPPSAGTKRINSRSKGIRGEREVIDLLQIVVNNTRNKYHLEPLLLQRNTLQAHTGGCDLHGLAGFSIEVKLQEAPYSAQWWQQALRQAGASLVPVLFYRQSRQPWTVKLRAYVNTPADRDQIQMDMVVGLGDFMEWFAEAYDEACVAELQALK